MRAECVVDARATLGEGPVWDTERQVCWWIDILGERIHRFDPAAGSDRTLATGDMVGAVALCTDGRLLVAARGGLRFLDPESGRSEPFGAGPALEPGVRFNDGKCDPSGRFWIGTMALDASPGRGELFCVEPRGAVSRRLAGVTISNGLAWAPSGDALFYIDTPTRCIAAFRFEPATGEISHRRVAVRVPERMGMPDGMTIDEEGMLWVALFGGGAVVRWDPATGRELARIDLPVRQVTSCTFGGPALDVLWITTAREGFSERDAAEQPLAGGLFRAEPGVRGLPPHRFGG